MNDFVTDEMVETAVTAVWNSDMHDPDTYVWDTLPMTDESRELWLRDVRTVLNASAPAIAAAAIRRAIDAADEAFAQEDIAVTQWGNGYIDGQGAALGFIRNYADELEANNG